MKKATEKLVTLWEWAINTRLGKWIMKIIDLTTADQVMLCSAQASYFLVISAVPLIMIIFALLGWWVTDLKQEILVFLDDALPQSAIELVSHLLDEISENKLISSLSISGVMLLWSASRGVVAVEKGFDNIYHSEERRNVFQTNLSAIVYTIGFVGVILASLIIMVFGKSIVNIITSLFPPVGYVLNSFILGTKFAYAGLLFLFFILAYSFVPKKRLKMRQQWIGAIFSTLGWTLFSVVFSFYIDNFSNKSYVYGSLTALIVLMLWIYICIIIMFLGAELNSWWVMRCESKNVTKKRKN